jgi:hypothetical protein
MEEQEIREKVAKEIEQDLIDFGHCWRHSEFDDDTDCWRCWYDFAIKKAAFIARGKK